MNLKKENNCDARVNRSSAGAAIELEPVNAVYRFHRKRKNDVR